MAAVRTPRNQQLARIHIAQRELQVPDVAYRDLVQRVAGVHSSADTDTTGRNAVIAELATVRMKRDRAVAANARFHAASVTSDVQVATLEPILVKHGRTWADASRLARRQFHARLEWLRADQLAWLAKALSVRGT